MEIKGLFTRWDPFRANVKLIVYHFRYSISMGPGSESETHVLLLLLSLLLTHTCITDRPLVPTIRKNLN